MGIDMSPIVPGVYAIPGLRMGRSYLVADRDGLMLVDSSSAGCSSRILQAIDAIGRRPEELHTIFATHYHHDHTGNVEALQRHTPAALAVHTEDAPYVDGRRQWELMHGALARLPFRPRPKRYALNVARELREGDVIDVAGGLEVIHLPGHTPGNSGLYSKALGIVFTGDALMNTLGLRQPLRVSTHDPEQARASVRKLAQYDFEHALPGHGHPILSRANDKIAEWAKDWT